VTDNTEILLACDRIDDQLEVIGSEVKTIRTLAGMPAGAWVFPIGTEEAPAEDWYCAQYFTWDGHPEVGHTGLDLNLDRTPYGDVDRGFPVWSIAMGRVHSVGSSIGWVGVVVIEHQHEGQSLYVRYAHLAPDSIVSEGQLVTPGQLIGVIGNYIRGKGGDHLHYDMAPNKFNWWQYRTPDVGWRDPVPILKAHLPPERVDAMLERRSG
jgi:murein DD-endopeptidase MepM/ murein hydrolase activator NlpD